MKVLVWQWGRRGAGPRFAAHLAQAFRELPQGDAALCLSAGAEILRGSDAPRCDLSLPIYDSVGELLWRAVRAPILVPALARRVRQLDVDLAVCAMPAPLDLLSLAAMHRAKLPVAVVVHDADRHPGDVYPLLFALQRRFVRGADAVVTLSGHVAARLRAQGVVRSGVPLVSATHPPFVFGPASPTFAHGGPIRVLSFGRLLPYKGLDLLADALRRLGPRSDMHVRVVGQGPESPALAALRTLSGVAVENRWVPETELRSLITWADMLVLSYTESSQSGPAAAALAAGRLVLATRVGGLPEQLGGEPLATLCDPDAKSLAAALARLLETPPAALPRAVDAAAAWRHFAQRVLEVTHPLRSQRPGS